MALLVTLLGVLVLELAVAGVFHVSLQQLRIARAGTRAVQLKAAAQSALAAVLGSWSQLTDSLAAGDSVVVGRSDAQTRIDSRATVRHLGGGLFYVRAEAMAGQGERRAVGALLRTLDPATFLRAVPAAAAAAAARVEGTVDGRTPPDCEPPPAALLERAGLALVDTAGLDPLRVNGVPPLIVLDSLPPFGSLGGLDLRHFAPTEAAMDSLVLTPLPCDPADSAGCGEPALRHFEGSLRISGGTGGGILIVNGDLTIGGGARFEGLALVSGMLRIEGGAELRGSARALRLEVLDATLRYDPCTLVRVLRAGPGLRGPFRASGHWWLPAA